MEERDRERIVEETPRVERETTVINTGDGRGGGGGTIAAVVVLLALIILGFLYFNGTFGGGDETNLNVNIDAPDVDLPDVDVPAIPGNSS